MSNIKLPVSKDINWGPALNSYLSQLENRVGSIEGQIAASATDNSKFNMANATYASSGWSVITADLKGEIKDNTLTVVVNGTAYYGGTSITPVVYDNRSYTVTLDDDKAYFVYLKYDDNNTTLEKYSEYKYGYSYILVGFVKRNKKFIPYYQTCTQSQFQQKYDLDHIWGNMDNLYVIISVDKDGNIKISTTTDSKYIINGLYITKDLFILTDPEPAIKYTVSGMAKPIYETIVGEKEPQLSESGTYESGYNKGLYRYGRILVDVFGDMYVQYPNINDRNVKDWEIVKNNQPEYIAVNNQLYNLAFYSVNDEKLGYRPNMMLEVGRFAIVGGAVNVTYSQSGDKSDKIYFAKALNAGIMCQQSQNAWVSNTGDVSLSPLLFRNVNDGYPFKINYNQSASTTDYPTFIIDKDKTIRNDNCFLFENHKTSNIISFKHNYNAHFQIGSYDTSDNELNTCGYANIILDNDSFRVGDKRNVDLSRPFNIFIGNSVDCENKVFGSIGDYKTENVTYNHIGLLKTISEKTEDGYFYATGMIELFSGRLKARTPTSRDEDDSSIEKEDYIAIGSTSQTAGDKQSIIRIHSDEKIALSTGAKVLSSKIVMDNNNILFDYDFDESTTPGNLGYISISRNNDENKVIDFTADCKNITLKSQNPIKCSSIEMQEGAYITYISDRRCKENISALKFNYLDTILKTPVVHYNYLNDSIHQVGIIAQDLEDNLPANQDVFIRKTNSDGLKNRRSIAETKLVYILWKGLQEEAQAREKLEKELEELKNKIK